MVRASSASAAMPVLCARCRECGHLGAMELHGTEVKSRCSRSSHLLKPPAWGERCHERGWGAGSMCRLRIGGAVSVLIETLGL